MLTVSLLYDLILRRSVKADPLPLSPMIYIGAWMSCAVLGECRRVHESWLCPATQTPDLRHKTTFQGYVKIKTDRILPVPPYRDELSKIVQSDITITTPHCILLKGHTCTLVALYYRRQRPYPHDGYRPVDQFAGFGAILLVPHFGRCAVHLGQEGR